MTDEMLSKFATVLDVIARDPYHHDKELYDICLILLDLDDSDATKIGFDFIEEEYEEYIAVNILRDNSYISENTGVWESVVDHDRIYLSPPIGVSLEDSSMCLPINHPLVTDLIMQLRMMEL